MKSQINTQKSIIKNQLNESVSASKPSPSSFNRRRPKEKNFTKNALQNNNEENCKLHQCEKCLKHFGSKFGLKKHPCSNVGNDKMSKNKSRIGSKYKTKNKSKILSQNKLQNVSPKTMIKREKEKQL